MRTTKRPRRESNRRLAAQPQGVYGTRTAQRIRAARQRRAAQSLMALIVGLLLLAMLAWRWQSRRTAPRAPSWSYALAASPSAEPFLENDQLFIPTQNGALIAFAMQQKTARSFSVSDFALTTQPLVRGEAAFVGGADGVLRAVNWKTGKIAWSVRTAATISTRPALLTHSALTAHSLSTQQTALLVVGNDAGEIVGCAAGNGRVLWRYQAGAPIGNAILAASVNGEERIFVPLLAGKQTRGGVLCLSSEGKKMWERDLGAARVAPLVVLPVSTASFV